MFEFLSTLAAVVLGGAISLLTSWLLEYRRAKRDRTERWDTRRFDALAAFGAAVKAEVRVLLRIAATFGFSKSQPIPIKDALPLYEAAAEERSLRFEALLLLADDETREAAREWFSKVRDIKTLLLDSEHPLQEDFDARYKEAGILRTNYYRSARAHLDIPGDAGVPTSESEFQARRF